MIRTRILLPVLLAGTRCFAQWEVPASIVLDGPDPEQRQVTGLSAPQSATDGANVAAERTANTAFGEATGVNDLLIELTPVPVSIPPGMRITMRPSSANIGAVTVNVNGVGAVPLLKHVNAPLDSGDLRPGIPVGMIYDGAAFQVTSQLYPGCPAGYKPISRGVCVEVESHGPSNWYAANNACMAQGARLCGFSEWIQACLQPDNIFGSIVNYEWVDEAANSVNDAKAMGVNENTLLPDCRAGSTRSPLTQLQYRCCYDR